MGDWEWTLTIQPRRQKGFNPDQPRVPAGQTGGGRWTSGSGDSASAERTNQDKYDVEGSLRSNFHSKREAIEWMESQGIKVGGRGWADTQVRQIADTLVDLKKKMGSLVIKSLQFRDEEWSSASYTPSAKKVNLSVNDTLERSKELDLKGVDDEIANLSVGANAQYRQKLLEQRELLRTDAYREGHTMYWFGGGRALEAVLRHEMGHAYHDRYANWSVRDENGRYMGIDDLLLDEKTLSKEIDWRKEYGITTRGQDAWGECVAENFVAWSVGKTDLMNPRMAKMFDLISEQSLEQ